jgi:hypothetical protein
MTILETYVVDFPIEHEGFKLVIRKVCRIPNPNKFVLMGHSLHETETDKIYTYDNGQIATYEILGKKVVFMTANGIYSTHIPEFTTLINSFKWNEKVKKRR